MPRHPLVPGSKGVNRQESWLCTQHFSLGIADRDKTLLAMIARFLFFSPVVILLSRVLKRVCSKSPSFSSTTFCETPSRALNHFWKSFEVFQNLSIRPESTYCSLPPPPPDSANTKGSTLTYNLVTIQSQGLPASGSPKLSQAVSQS